MNLNAARVCFALLAPMPAAAQVPAILIEACSLLETATKRVECLQAANKRVDTSPGQAPPQRLYNSAPSRLSSGASQLAPSPTSNFNALSGQTCFVGPRGGTYTITKSGKKSYGGC